MAQINLHPHPRSGLNYPISLTVCGRNQTTAKGETGQGLFDIWFHNLI